MPDAAGQGACGPGDPAPGIRLSRKRKETRLFLTPPQPRHPGRCQYRCPGLSLRGAGGTGSSGSRAFAADSGRGTEQERGQRRGAAESALGLPGAAGLRPGRALAASQLPRGPAPHPGGAPQRLGRPQRGTVGSAWCLRAAARQYRAGRNAHRCTVPWRKRPIPRE